MRSLENQLQTYTGKIAFFDDPETGKPDYEINTVVARPILQKQQMFKPQRATTLERYRHYVHGYNDAVATKNNDVVAQNSMVDVFVLQNVLQGKAAAAQFAFMNDLGKVSTDEYNRAVDLQNEKLGLPLIKKRMHAPVRKPVEHTFALLMSKYSYQIDRKNKMYESNNALPTRAVQRVKVDHHDLANTYIDGVRALPYCKRTIQNHINRLSAAGVLYDYSFHGHQKPVQMSVNNHILCLFNAVTRKSVTFDSQSFKYKIEKDLPNKKRVTNTKQNKIEIIGNVEKHYPVKEFISQLPIGNIPIPDTNTTQHRGDESGDEKQAAAQFFNEKSEVLRGMIEDDYNLVDDLASGQYENFRLTFMKQLVEESMYGNMQKGEYLILLRQTFMKLAAPIYAGDHAYAGAWTKSIELIDELFNNNNGSTPGKVNLLYRFEGLQYRIGYARQYVLKKKEWKRLFPHEFFDPARNFEKSGGFALTLGIYKEKLKSRERHLDKKLRRNAKAAKLKKRYAIIANVEKKIRSVIANKITMSELHDYISYNAHIPEDIQARIPQMIERMYKTK